MIIEHQDEEPYTNVRKDSQSLIYISPNEASCVNCEKSSFAGMKEEIRRRKEMLACSLQKVTPSENSTYFRY